MAGDWIKMRCDLDEDPAVIGIADRTGLDTDTVIGKLYRFWSWANRQSRDGNAPVTLAYVDRNAGTVGFARALIEVGWLEAVGDGAIRIPNFDRHNSNTAKQRALGQSRASRYRNAHVTTNALPEKRREEKRRKKEEIPPLPPTLDTPAFRAKWDEWLSYKRSRRETLQPVTQRSQLKKFAEWGEDRAIAAIEFTIFKGYQGILEPDNGTNANGGKPGLYEGLQRFAEKDDD